nr:hypothetical protein [Tanacetum cinerariifolium]
MVDEMLDDGDEVDEAAEARRAQDENKRGLIRRLNKSFTNRLRRWTIGLYDQFFKEFEGMRLEQQRYQSWSADRMSQL